MPRTGHRDGLNAFRQRQWTHSILPTTACSWTTAAAQESKGCAGNPSKPFENVFAGNLAGRTQVSSGPDRSTPACLHLLREGSFWISKSNLLVGGDPPGQF